MRAMLLLVLLGLGCNASPSNPPAEPPKVLVPPGDYPSRSGPPSLDHKPGS